MTVATKPVHVNGVAVASIVAPPNGSDVVDAIQRSVDGIRRMGGVPHVNHPNFGWAVTVADLARVERLNLFEIYNGHPQVNNAGGGGVPGLEQMWDQLLTGGRLLYGVAVDDAHHFKRPGDPSAAAPGRGWVYVRAEALEPRMISEALDRGDFYASTGVELAEYTRSGAHRGQGEADGLEQVPDPVHRQRRARVVEVADTSASYAVKGDEGLRAGEGAGVERADGVDPAGPGRPRRAAAALSPDPEPLHSSLPFTASSTVCSRSSCSPSSPPRPRPAIPCLPRARAVPGAAAACLRPAAVRSSPRLAPVDGSASGRAPGRTGRAFGWHVAAALRSAIASATVTRRRLNAGPNDAASARKPHDAVGAGHVGRCRQWPAASQEEYPGSTLARRQQGSVASCASGLVHRPPRSSRIDRIRMAGAVPH